MVIESCFITEKSLTEMRNNLLYFGNLVSLAFTISESYPTCVCYVASESPMWLGSAIMKVFE